MREAFAQSTHFSAGVAEVFILPKEGKNGVEEGPCHWEQSFKALI